MAGKRTIVYVDNFLAEHGATPTTGVTLTSLFERDGYTVIRAGTKLSKPARLFEMLGAIRRNRNAIILIAVYSTSAFYFAWACARLCRLLGAPYIPCLHGGNLPQRISNNPGLSGQIFAHSYTNVVVSGYLQASLNQRNWRSVLIPNSINIAQYPFLHRSKLQPKLLWVRSFHHIYNPQLAIQLVNALAINYPAVTLTMVGPDKDGSLDACKKLADELGVSDKITYTGRLTVNDWVAASALHDIFINTTNFDNLPVSVIEAMALGLPVVSTNVGGLPYLVTNNSNGILVPAEDLPAMQQAVESLLSNPVFAGNISMAARKEAEKYSEIEVLALWGKLFDNI